MAGHSKWAQIKRKKAVADAKKGAVFGKLARAISVAARGNPDPSTNLRLKSEVDRARAVNMPSDSIERAIRRVADRDAAALSEVTLELVGPGSAAIIVQAITDNSNRTVHEVKRVAADYGARMAGQGSLLWMFKASGVVRRELGGDDESALQLAAIDAGADDVSVDDGTLTATCSPQALERVRSALGPAAAASTELLPTTTTALPSPEDQRRLEELLDVLDDLDDVQAVYVNAEY